MFIIWIKTVTGEISDSEKPVDITSVHDVSSYIRKVRNSKFNQMRCIINNGHILRKANYKISIIDTRRSESDLKKKNVKRYIIYWFVLSALFNFLCLHRYGRILSTG